MVIFSKYLKYTKKIIFILFYFLIILIITTLVGCGSSIIAPESNCQNDNNIAIHSYIFVKGNPDEIIKDCTPELSIFTNIQDICFMSFSGNGAIWSEWIDYSQSYNEFNIASGLNGTTMESGFKTVYLRFKDINGNIFPKDFQDSICCHFEYELQPLFSLEIEPKKVQLKIKESQKFTVKGYAQFRKDEVPLDGQKIIWEKTCGVGTLAPIVGLKTVYTAPEIPGTRDISAHYGSLGTGAWVEVVGTVEQSDADY